MGGVAPAGANSRTRGLRSPVRAFLLLTELSQPGDGGPAGPGARVRERLIRSDLQRGAAPATLCTLGAGGG